MLNIKPTNDRVIIKRAEPPKMSKGGIHLVEKHQRRTTTGMVMAVGPGRRIKTGPNKGEHEPMTLKVGDKVIIERKAIPRIKIDGEEYLDMRESEIIAVVE